MNAVVITPAQARYLFIGPTAIGLEVTDSAIAITNYTPDDGWLFVEEKDRIGQEGSGVWVDTEGNEHYGPNEHPTPPTMDQVLAAVQSHVSKEAAR